MKKLTTILSNTAPNVRDALWLKPVSGGFTLYALFNGCWQPLKLVDDNSTPSDGDDTVQDLIGSTEDAKTADTINGAKAFAQDQAEALKGTSSDESTDMTLYGLKAYIDEQIAGLG